jgi:ABC-type sugar transport system, permease component
MSTTRSVFQQTLLYSAVLGIVLWTLAPFYWMLVSSVSEQRDLFSFPPIWFPRTISFERFEQLLGLASLGDVDEETARPARLFRTALMNSVLVCGITTLIGLTAGTIAAYSYARLRFAFSRHLMALTVMVHMLPPIATVIPLYILLKKVGLLNQLSGLILVYAALSVTYVVWVMSGYFRTIPKELEESARIDGCSRMGALMRVILPIVTPGLIATGILVFITTWNEFLYVLVLINDPANKTVPVMIAEFSTQDQIKYGMIMTGGIIVSLPPVLLALIFQRRLISGLTAGAVKG